jgi:Uncharacterized protein conserved in bacteria (DUF2090)
MTDTHRPPTRADPLMILAMDHRESFGRTLFSVKDDRPTSDQVAAMESAKSLIYQGLVRASARVSVGHAGVLVDERYGQAVIDAARQAAITLAVPIEHSGREWFELEWGDEWREHVRRVRPDYAKVLVRDNPGYDANDRHAQLSRLRVVSDVLHEEGVPLLYELLVPATSDQLSSTGGDAYAYDRDVRPALVARVMADNQRAASSRQSGRWRGSRPRTLPARSSTRREPAGGPWTRSSSDATRQPTGSTTGSTSPHRFKASLASPSAEASGKTPYAIGTTGKSARSRASSRSPNAIWRSPNAGPRRCPIQTCERGGRPMGRERLQAHLQVLLVGHGHIPARKVLGTDVRFRNHIEDRGHTCERPYVVR